MDASTSLPLVSPLPRPAAGTATRMPVGRHALVLEAVRGGYSLLWSDGTTARRHVVALGRDGFLTLQLRAPRAAVHVATRDALVVVPGARVRGYLLVPLTPTVVWHDANGASHVVVEMRPPDLTAEWDEQRGYTLHGTSAWHTRFPVRSDEPRVVVPLHLRNSSRVVLSPAALPVTLADDDLVPKRGSIVVTPRRLEWTGVWADKRSLAARVVEARA